MTRTQLTNSFLKNKSDENRETFSKQRNLCAPLLRVSKKNYFAITNENQIKDNLQTDLI